MKANRTYSRAVGAIETNIIQWRGQTDEAPKATAGSADVFNFEAEMPSAYFFRRALNEASDLQRAKVVAAQVLKELENYAEQMREAGITPRARFVLSTEADAKGLEIIQPSAHSRKDS